MMKNDIIEFETPYYNECSETVWCTALSRDKS